MTQRIGFPRGETLPRSRRITGGHGMMPDDLSTDDFCDAVLLQQGWDSDRYRSLVMHLQAAGIDYKMLDFASNFSGAAAGGEGDEMEFLRGFGDRLLRMTNKELLVLQKLLAGQTNKAISQQLDLTERAVELRKASLMKKLQVSSHTELIRLTTRFETLQRLLLRPLRGDHAGDREMFSDETTGTVRHAPGKKRVPSV